MAAGTYVGMGEQRQFHKHNAAYTIIRLEVKGNLFWVTWSHVGGTVMVLLVDRRGVMTYVLQTTGKHDIQTQTHIKNTNLSSHTHKEEFMVGFNYLRHQIKRTKCASQEYAG